MFTIASCNRYIGRGAALPTTECAGASSCSEVAAVAIRGEAGGRIRGNRRAVSPLTWLQEQVEVVHVCHVYVAYVQAE